MTTMTTTPGTTLTPRAAVTIGVASAFVGGVLALLLAHGWGDLVLIAPFLVAVTAGVFGYVVPRALRRESSGGTALGLAVPAALLVAPAFWSGLPLVLGIAATIVGNHGRQARTGSGKAIVGLVLGALTVLFYLAIHVTEAAAGNMGFFVD